MTQTQISQREQDKEKAKSDRISQQNTQQSELINKEKQFTAKKVRVKRRYLRWF